MKPARIIVLAVALVAAVGLALVVRSMTSGKPTSQAVAAPVAAKPMARVLVAQRDLAVGDRLGEGDLKWQAWPADSVNAAFVTDGSVAVANNATSAPADKPADKSEKGRAVAEVTRVVADLSGADAKANFVGAVVREAFLAGEPIVDRKLVRAGETGYLSVVLAPGMRAMAVPVTVETAAGGFILPGDRVDVILSRELRLSDALGDGAGRSKFASNIVLQNVKILAIDQTTRTDKDEKAVVGATATLELSPRDTEALALAKSEGDLSLVLRSYADTNGPSGRVAAAVPQRAEANTVRVFRGGDVDVVVTP